MSDFPVAPYAKQNSGSSGSGLKVTFPKAVAAAGRQADPERDLLRTALRMQQNAPHSFVTKTALKEVLRDYSPQDLANASSRYGVDFTALSPYSGGGNPHESLFQKVTKGPKNAFVWTVKQISKPGQAVVSGLNREITTGKPGAFLTGAKEGFQLKDQTTPKELLNNATGGEYNKQLKQLPKPIQPLAAGGAEFGTAVALDPLTYVTFGTGKAAEAGLESAGKMFGKAAAERIATQGLEKALSPAQRGAFKEVVGSRVYEATRLGGRGGIGVKYPQLMRGESKRLLSYPKTIVPGSTIKAGLEKTGIAPVARAIENTGPFQKVAQGLEKAFVPRAGIKQAERAGELPKGTANKVGYEMSTNISRAKMPAEDAIHEIQVAINDAKASKDDLSAVFNSREMGQNIATLPEKLQPVRQAVDNVLGQTYDVQKEHGLLNEIFAQTPLTTREQYVTRQYTKEGAKFVKQKELQATAPVGASKGLKAQASKSLNARTFEPDLSAHEVNVKYAKDVPGGIFEEAPTQAVSKRIQEAYRDTATQDTLQNLGKLKDNSGKSLVQEATPNAVKPDGFEEANFVGKKFYVHPDVLPELKKTQAILGNDETITALGKFADKWMSYWKSGATTFVPFGIGFTMRNKLGNMLLNRLADIPFGSPVYGRSANLLRKMEKGVKVGDPYKFLSAKDANLIKQARAEGVIGAGFFQSDFGQEALHEAASKSTKASLRKVMHSGRNFNELVENHDRLAHFIYKMDEFNGDARKAAESVKKYLFDYNDLTEFERKRMKRIMAFYTFTRKNLPLQVEALLKNPGKLSSEVHLKQVATEQSGQKPGKLYPGYLAEGTAVPLPLGVSKGLSKIPGVGINPKVPIVLSPDTPMRQAGQTIEPYLNAAAEIPGLGRVLPKNEEGKPGVARQLLGQTVSGGLPGAALTGAQVAGQRQFFTGQEMYPGSSVTTPFSKIPFTNIKTPLVPKKIPTETNFALGQLIPPYTKITSALPPDEKGKEKAGRRRLSMFSGLQLQPVGPETQKSEAYRRLTRIQGAANTLKYQGVNLEPLPRKKSLKFPTAKKATTKSRIVTFGSKSAGYTFPR